jgi:NAD+--asparagine ADP-ribosyltransferase
VASDFAPGVSNVKDGIFAIPGIGNVAKYIGKGAKLAYNGIKSLGRGADVASDTAKVAGKTVGDAAAAGKTASADEVGNVGGKNVDKPYSNPKNRPAYGEGQVDEVWDKAKQPDGNVYDPNTGEKLEWDKDKSRAGQWDMGHNSGKEYRKSHKDYMDGKITKEEFLNEYRDPSNYKPEAPSPKPQAPSSNRSGQFEEK